MTGKVLDGNPAAFLILILPLAAGIVLLYKAWLWILGVVGLTILWKAWDNYQWQQWCFEMNPIFNELLQANQGCLTAMDVSLKANLTARSANRFLTRKAQEYGAYCKELPDQGKVYYFITASTLGSIFDDSEPSIEDSEEIETLPNSTNPEILPKASETKTEIPPKSPETRVVEEPSSTATSPFSQLAELKEERQKLSQTASEASPDLQPETVPETTPESSLSSPLSETNPEPGISSETPPESSLTEDKTAKKEGKLSLIQVDLAKRLDTTPSTIGRRKTDSNFPEWSQSKDPEGIAWKYLRKSRLFVPVDTN